MLWQGVANYLVVDEYDGAVERGPRSGFAAVRSLACAAELQLTFIALHPAVLDIVFSRQLHSDNPAVKADFQRLMAVLFAH